MTTNNRLIYQILFAIIIEALLLGCSKSEPTPSPDQMDKSPFTGIPCTAPCWQGLVIGESSESDVMSTLPTLTFINQNTIQMFRGSRPTIDYSSFAPGVEITADCVHPNDKQCLSLIVVDDLLTGIVVALNYEIRSDKATEYLGNPDFIGYQNLGAERIICEVYLVWIDRQLVLASKFEGPKAANDNCYVVRGTGKIASSLLISEARYMSFTALETLLSTGTGEFFNFTGTIPEK